MRKLHENFIFPTGKGIVHGCFIHRHERGKNKCFRQGPVFLQNKIYSDIYIIVQGNVSCLKCVTMLVSD